MFAFSAWVLVFSFKFPKFKVEQLNSLFDMFAKKMDAYQTIPPQQERIQRSPLIPKFEDSTFKDMDVFFKSQLNSQQTFLDFSNSPMLYFYTNRKTVSFFNQTPNMLHNDPLQQWCQSGAEHRQYRHGVCVGPASTHSDVQPFTEDRVADADRQGKARHARKSRPRPAHVTSDQ